MNTESDNSTPDVTQTRRNIVKSIAGLTSLSALAGCGENQVNPEFNGNPPPSNPGNKNSSDNSENTISSMEILPTEFSQDSVTVEVNFDWVQNQLDGLTIQVHQKQVFKPDTEWRQIGEETTSFSGPEGGRTTHDIALDLELETNVPTEIRYQVLSDGTRVKHMLADNAIMKFENQTTGTTELRDLGPRYAPQPVWKKNADTEPVRVEIWYNTPDESPFNMPSLDDEYYNVENINGNNWYELYDIELTAIIRQPVLTKDYATTENEDVDPDSLEYSGIEIGPYFDWTVINFQQSEVEYLESLLWNSPPTMFLEKEGWSVGEITNYKEVERRQEWASTVRVRRGEVTNEIAQNSDSAFTSYIEATQVFGQEDRYGNDYEPGDVTRGVNPISFAAGRSVCRRLAETITAAYESKPYLDQFDHIDYHKLVCLKGFVGGGLPYSWQLSGGGYHQTPEESILEMFKFGTDRDSRGGDCVAATLLFLGVGTWLIDAEPVCVYKQYGKYNHVLSGWYGLDLPDNLRRRDTTNVTFSTTPLERLESARDEVGGFEYLMVECTERFSTVGYERFADPIDRFVTCWSDGSEALQLRTQVPLNDAMEPDQAGEVRATEESNDFGLILSVLDDAQYHFT